MRKLFFCSCCRKKQKKLTNVVIESTNKSMEKDDRVSKKMLTSIYPTQSAIISETDKKSDEEKVPIKNATLKTIKINTEYSEHGLNIMKDIEDDDILLKEDSVLINDYEKDKITYTKKGLVEYFDKMSNKQFRKYYDKDNLQIYIDDTGSELNNKLSVVKSVYKEKKEKYGSNIDCKKLMDYMYDLNYRLKWDNQFHSIKIFEGENHCLIVQSWALSPIFFVSERDSVEKRFIYEYNDRHYCISSSIPENVYNY